MKHCMTACLLICASFAIAQQAQGQSGSTSPSSSGKEDGQVTMRGCLGKFGEDYTLSRPNARRPMNFRAVRGSSSANISGNRWR
jgi:hypothetical protein